MTYSDAKSADRERRTVKKDEGCEKRTDCSRCLRKAQCPRALSNYNHHDVAHDARFKNKSTSCVGES